MAESVYDHPFQWGSKRTGPDLAREGGKYPNLWHYRHLIDPRSVSPGSNMPPFAFMAKERVDIDRTADKMRALRSVGVPYRPEDIAQARADALAQGEEIAANLRQDGVSDIDATSEIVALIAYLQRLGQHGEKPSNAGDAVSVAK